MRLGVCSLALLCPLLSMNPPFAAAETFESLTYSPPPGFAVQDTPEGRVYVGKEPNGTGNAVIALYKSQPGTITAQQAFATYWRTHVERVIPGPPPEPKIGQEGDFTLAAGTKQAAMQGLPISASIVAFTGRGRVFGVMGIAAGQEMGRAVLAFIASLRLNAAAPAKAPTTGEPEIDFEIPPRYVTTREGSNIVLSPMSTERPTPCTFIIGPPRPSKGSLDADA
jgi:hypothetical protein